MRLFCERKRFHRNVMRYHFWLPQETFDLKWTGTSIPCRFWYFSNLLISFLFLLYADLSLTSGIWNNTVKWSLFGIGRVTVWTGELGLIWSRHESEIGFTLASSLNWRLKTKAPKEFLQQSVFYSKWSRQSWSHQIRLCFKTTEKFFTFIGICWITQKIRKFFAELYFNNEALDRSKKVISL